MNSNRDARHPLELWPPSEGQTQAILCGACRAQLTISAYLRTDTTTQGNWRGTYGSDGYSVANDSQAVPAYASFAVQNQQDYTWSNSPTDARSLQTGSASGRIAAVWYNTPEFNFDVNFTDGNSHQFALYAVDWDNSGRAETIQILDAATDALLDTRSISNFTNGLYLAWNVSGHIKINVILTAGNNSVVSGVFFGGGSAINSAASFVRTDTTTQGSWHGTYGSDGYSIANDSQSLPAYANFAVENQANWTWVPLTADPRALQNGSNSGSIAATWYNTPEFNLDVNLTDGQSHQLALYAMDWDSSGRAETVELLDAATGALLDTRNISSFVNGLYLVWNISGHVKINIIQTAGNNAVVSGIFFASPVPPPSITRLSPNAGSAGASITITGNNFGPTQGNSSVSFNGTPAVPTSWSSTQVIVPVPSGATTGNVVLTAPGGASNGVPFTFLASAPPTVTSSISPSPNSAGWFNTNVTLSYSCTAGGAPLAPSSCPSPQIVATEGANQQIIASVTDTAGVTGTFSTTLSIDKTRPALTIASPSDGTAYSSAGVTISGSVSDSLSGLASMSCNGTVVPVTSGTFSCNISLNVGVNLVVVRATDLAGNVSGSNFHLTLTGTLPLPNSLQITPTGVNMVVSQTQQFTAVDEQGRPRSDAAWTINDTSLASITTDSSPTLTAIAVGQVTLTATVQSASVQVQINILAGASLAPGTVLWTAPPVFGSPTSGLIQAVPTAGSTPDLYGIGADSNGNNLISALTSDGQRLWQANVGPGVLSPDGFGGVLTTSTSGLYPYLTTTVSDFDGATGSQVWSYSTPAQTSIKAIRQDGAVFHIETTAPDANNFNSTSSSLVAVDGTVGAPLLRLPLPSTTVKVFDCNGILLQNSLSGPEELSNLEIDSDGTVSVAINVETEITNGYDCIGGPTSVPYTTALSLFQLKPDGSTLLTPIHTNTEDLATATSGRLPRALPWQVIPDGQGGSLVAWTDYSSQQAPDYITHLGPSGQNDYPFPSLYQIISSMVLGDNGVAYATDSQTIQAFDINSGQPLWTYVSQALDGIAIIASTSGGGLVTKEFPASRSETVLRLDSTGQPTYDGTGTATPAPPFGSGIDYSWRGQWYASLNAMSASLALQPIPLSWASAWAEPEGNASQTNEAVNHHSFGLFWCGTGYGETGSCSNRNDGDDVAFDYFPESNNVSDLHPLSTYNPANFASSNPGFVDIIESEALKAYQKAFSDFGVVVQKGSTHLQAGTQVPDQEFRQYVVGTWPTPATGKSFPSSGSSNLYYFSFMLGAQDALLNSPNSTFSPPSWPPTAQNNASFLTLMKTIGRGVGNAAAHETGHLLEVIHPPMGSFFHVNPGFPYMDCGIGNPDPTGAIHCQNGNNFVYGFFSANGTPQDPNNESNGGGSFFYIDISGHPIHWGPDNVCWLVNWTGPGSCEF